MWIEQGREIFGEKHYIRKDNPIGPAVIPTTKINENPNQEEYHSKVNYYIKPNYIVAIPDYNKRGSGNRTYLQIASETNLTNNNQKGMISNKADKKIRNAVNWLFSSAKNKRVYSKVDEKSYYFKVNLITLTLPTTKHELSDSEFKNDLLKKFLFNAKYSYGLRNYVWKVETQENGNIHAHITSDTFIHWKDLQKCWNKILSKTEMMDEFEKKNGHRNPNSTDIHAIKNIKNLQAYICEYLAKNEDGRRKIKGRLWGSNYNISDAQKCNVSHTYTSNDDVAKFTNNTEIKKIPIETKPDCNGNKIQIGEIFFMDEKSWDIAPKVLKDTYNNRRFIIRNNIGKCDIQGGSRGLKYNMTYEV